tara:strand:+ start:1259 stop:1510 length:252 start_codon:yes stop_codon:yes gene_type:complete
MSTIKLSQEEISKLEESRTEENKILVEAGRIALNKILFQEREDQNMEEYKMFRSKQNELAQSLQDKYGEGTINIDSGEFIKAE